VPDDLLGGHRLAGVEPSVEQRTGDEVDHLRRRHVVADPTRRLQALDQP
jgi:hypothetical protein